MSIGKSYQLKVRGKKCKCRTGTSMRNKKVIGGTILKHAFVQLGMFQVTQRWCSNFSFKIPSSFSDFCSA